MRFYNIVISDTQGGTPIRQFTSLNAAGRTMGGALNIELDVPVFRMAEPAGAAYLKIWGISIKDVGQAFDLNNKVISIFAGMAKGLPLANPSQAGLILQGTITQAFGNWQGLEQSLDFQINVLGAAPRNYILNWQKGTTLGDAIRGTLGIAAPELTVSVATADTLVLNQDEKGFYENLPQFAAYVKGVSQHINPDPAYQGVDIVLQGNAFTVYDGTSPIAPTAIAFTDLIGQPTWIAPGVIQFKTVMRADLSVSDYITLPASQVTTTAQSYSQYRDGSIFSGSFQIDTVRHVGNFRQPDANSWVTVYDCHVP